MVRAQALEQLLFSSHLACTLLYLYC